MKALIARGVALALVAGVAGGAVAPDPADARRKKVVRVVTVKTAQAFKAADTDANRQLDRAEWSAAGANPDAFGLVDGNSNGTVGYWEALMAILQGLKGRLGA
jgi:hypothetical protein